MANDMELTLKKLLREATELEVIDTVDVDTDLFELGLNSMMFIKAMVAIEEEFGFEFDDMDLDFTKYNTLGALIRYVEARQVTSNVTEG